MPSPERNALPLALGVLDQSPVAQGSPGGQALRNSIELAQLAECFGYTRYWVAEHHGSPALACASPEALIGPIASATSRIRVGSGGVMLPHYSPLKVAETFSMLSGMFPGRIDLGIGRAPGTDAPTSFALQRDRRQRSPDDFPEQMHELLGYFAEQQPASMPMRRRTVLPGRPENPEPWLLGSSPQSAIWAAEWGLPYCFADFINANGVELVAEYRRTFQPSPWCAQPRVGVAAWTVCAETEDEAHDLASSFKMMMTLLHRGQLIAVPSVETALQFMVDEGMGLRQMPAGRRAIVGTPSVVRAGIESLAADYTADEMLLVNILFDHAARKRSYELVAKTFGLTARAIAAPQTGVAVSM